MIETERLILREWREADAERIYPMSRDARVMEFLGPDLTRDDARRLVAGQILNQSIFGHCFWPVERRSDCAFLGFCGLQKGPKNTPLDGRIEIGWRLAHDAWGQGYAREAAEAAVAWGWGNLADDQIFAITVPANTRSWGLMERLGMIRRADMDFGHPNMPSDSPLQRHITYAAERPA